MSRRHANKRRTRELRGYRKNLVHDAGCHICIPLNKPNRFFSEWLQDVASTGVRIPRSLQRFL